VKFAGGHDPGPLEIAAPKEPADDTAQADAPAPGPWSDETPQQPPVPPGPWGPARG